MTDLSLSWSWMTGWFWLAVPFLLLLSWWMYHKTVPRLAPLLHWLLFGLRSVSLLLILLLLWNPVLQLEQRFTRPAETAILIDASLSMAFPAAKVDSTLRWLQLLEKPFAATSISYFLCGDTLLALGDTAPETLSCNQPVTNLAQSLEQLNTHFAGRNLQAVVLLSDGGVNSGGEPARVLLPQVPLFVAGIGDTVALPDAGLRDLEVAPVLQPGDSATVAITVTACGMAGEQGELRLTLNGEQLSRRRIILPGDQFPLHEEFLFVSETQGRHKLQVELVTASGEETQLNNTLARYVDLQKNQHLVRIVAGAPSFDLEMISFLLGQLETIAVETWLLTSSFKIPAAAADADLIVLIDFPLPQTGQRELDTIQKQIDRLPTLWIPGAAVDRVRLAEMSQWSQLSSRFDPAPLFPRPQKVHPVLGQEADLQLLVQRWRGLPPVISQYRLQELPAQAQILLGSDNSTERPLLIVQEGDSQSRRAWLLARDSWKWHLQMQEHASGQRLYADLLADLTRWLTVTVDERQLQIAPLQEIFQENQPVRFQGLVIDDSRQAVAGAELKLEISSDSLTDSYRLSDEGNGRYQVKLGLLPEGDYSYQISGNRGSYLLSPETGLFAVAPFSIEFRTPVLNSEPLRRLARVSGGLYLNDASAHWQDELQFYNQLVHSEQDHLLRNKWLLLSVILLLLFVEWFLRKYNHLL